MRLMLSTIGCLLLSACASSPVPDEQPVPAGYDVVRSVELCRTKAADLETKLGTPSRDGLLGDTRVMTWIVAWEPLVKYLGVMLDKDDTVVDVYWNLPSEIAWAPIDRCRKQ